LYEALPNLEQEQKKQVKRQLVLSEYQAVQDLINDDLITSRVGSEEKRLLLTELEALNNSEQSE
jgi:hypothetical protein